MPSSQNSCQQRSVRAAICHQMRTSPIDGSSVPARGGPGCNKNRSQQQNNYYCVLCKRNGETELVYRNHKLRDENNQVVCPVLKQFTCPHCQARGDHTSGYCPFNPARKSPATPRVGSNNRKESKTTKQTAQPARAQRPQKDHPSSRSSLELPHFCRANCRLDYDQFSSLLRTCTLLKPEARLEYLYQRGYNLSRFQKIQQIVLAWRTELMADTLKLAMGSSPWSYSYSIRPLIDTGSPTALTHQFSLM